MTTDDIAQVIVFLAVGAFFICAAGVLGSLSTRWGLLRLKRRVSAWWSRRRIVRRSPEQLLAPVGEQPVFPAHSPMQVRGRGRYPERKPSGGPPLSTRRRARTLMHTQIRLHLMDQEARKK